jgi:hypothetical protein
MRGLFADTNGGMLLPPDTNTYIHRDLIIALVARLPPLAVARRGER